MARDAHAGWVHIRMQIYSHDFTLLPMPKGPAEVAALPVPAEQAQSGKPRYNTPLVPRNRAEIC